MQSTCHASRGDGNHEHTHTDYRARFKVAIREGIVLFLSLRSFLFMSKLEETRWGLAAWLWLYHKAHADACLVKSAQALKSKFDMSHVVIFLLSHAVTHLALTFLLRHLFVSRAALLGTGSAGINDQETGILNPLFQSKQLPIFMVQRGWIKCWFYCALAWMQLVHSRVFTHRFNHVAEGLWGESWLWLEDASLLSVSIMFVKCFPLDSVKERKNTNTSVFQ